MKILSSGFFAGILFLKAEKDSSIKIGCYWRSQGHFLYFKVPSFFLRALTKSLLGGTPLKKIEIKIDQMLSETLILKVIKFENVFIK